LGFLAVALYKADFLVVPRIYSTAGLVTSFVFLFAGFMVNVISWEKMLQASNYKVPWGDCLAGFGLSIFGKYIPGKIWMIVGRAAYVSEKGQYSLGALSAVSLKTQFIAIWFGLIFGMIGLFLLRGWHLWSWMILLTWVVLTVVIFSRFLHEKAERLICKLLRKEIVLPRLSISAILGVMPWFAGYWALWTVGFYLFVACLTEQGLPWPVGLGFPLAGTLGIMTFISPGGLGTREAVLVGYFSLAGIPLVEATTIAVASRLWFLGGELFIFVTGWIYYKRMQR
jgi:uncharacterized membrane protein YbhN (UPF0104 family)